MSTPAPIDVALQRRRLMLMLAIDAVCVMIAIAAMVAYLSFHIGWAGPVFAAAVIAGFGAQIWLVMGLRAAASKPGAKG